MRAHVGYADGRSSPPAEQVVVDDVSAVSDEGVRAFDDGVMAGILRSLRSRKIAGNLVHKDGSIDPEVFVVEPDFDGGTVPAHEAASKVALDWAAAGFYVICGTLMAYDTPYPQYLWKSRDAGPATRTDEFAVLLAPHQAAEARAMAFQKSSGGGG